MDIKKLEALYEENRLVTPLSERVTRTLRTGIWAGYLEPGERITEETIANLFHVSRTPSRDALRIIENDGFIVNIPHVGLVIRQWTLQDFYDLYAIAAPLEGLAAKLAARNSIPPAMVLQLKQVIEDTYVCFQKQDRQGGEQLNYDFHMTIARCSGNPFLIEILDGLSSKIRMLRPMVYGTFPPDRGLAYEDHQKILDCILAGDEETSERLGRQHLETTRQKTMAGPDAAPS